MKALGLALLLCAGPAQAQFLPIIGAGTPQAAAAPSYTGPCDVTGANCTQGWAIGALTGAYAAAAGNDFVAERTSDSATCTVKVNSAGNADLTTATNCASSTTLQSWATRGTFSVASITGTALTFTSLTGTATSGDQVIGTGVGANTTISGTCTSSPCTVVNPTSTNVTAITITDLIPLDVTTLYDQIGSNNVTTTSTAAYVLIWNCNNSLPCIYNSSAFNGDLYNAANNFTPLHLPSFSLVIDRTVSNQNAATTAISEDGGSGNQIAARPINTFWWLAYGGSSWTANDAAWHAFNVAYGGSNACNGTTDNCANADGTETALPANAPITTAGKPQLLSNGGDSFDFVLGFFSDNATVWSHTTRGAICHNEYTHWATATSC